MSETHLAGGKAVCAIGSHPAITQRAAGITRAISARDNMLTPGACLLATPILIACITP